MAYIRVSTKGEHAIDPTERSCGRGKKLSELRAEEGFTGIYLFENFECAASGSGGLSEPAEAMMDPIHQKKLLFEFVGARRDDFVELVSLTEFKELRVFGRIEFEEMSKLRFDERDGLKSGDERGTIAQLELHSFSFRCSWSEGRASEGYDRENAKSAEQSG
jgi:hypothetical protein